MMRGYGYYDSMMGGTGWWWQLVMLLFWLLVIAGVILLVVWVVRQMSGSGHAQGGPTAPTGPLVSGKDDACETARLRYAKGEIDKEQYEEICRTLGL